MSKSTGPYLLGIDYGTESCRVAIFDLQGRPVTFAATAYKTTHPRSGWAEQSPEDWWQATVKATKAVLRKAKKTLTGSSTPRCQYSSSLGM